MPRGPVRRVVASTRAPERSPRNGCTPAAQRVRAHVPVNA